MSKRDLRQLFLCALVSALVAGFVGAGFSRAFAIGSTSYVIPSTDDFRLTLLSGSAVPSADQTAKTTIFCTPYKGTHISLYDGTNWSDYQSAEFSLALGTLTNALPYDVFCFDSSGVPTLEFLAWTNATTRATALVQQNGVWSKTGALTRRYLGTFYTTATTTTEDSKANRFLWNASNRICTDDTIQSTTVTWTYGTNSWTNMDTASGGAGGALAWQHFFVVGLDEDAVEASACTMSQAAASDASMTFGLDSQTVESASATGASANARASLSEPLVAYWSGRPGIGKHYLNALMRAPGAASVTFYGAPGANYGTFGCRTRVWR